MAEHLDDDVLFQSSELRITSKLYPSRSIFVTFQSAVELGFDRKGFGEDFFRANRISFVCVKPLRCAWYQHREILDACASIRRATQSFDRVVTYGQSMGGYAAINFATALGATDVIAISPQYTIDPRRAPLETRYSDGLLNIDDFIYDQPTGRDWTGVDAFVFYDPINKLDAYQADLASGGSPVNLVKLHHSTHPSTQVISKKALKAMVSMTGASGVQSAVPSLIDAFKRDRAESWLYWLNLSRKAGSHNLRKSLWMAIRAERLRPNDPDILYQKGRILAYLGWYADAVETFDRCIEIAPNSQWLYEAKTSAAKRLRELDRHPLAHQDTIARSATLRQLVPSQNAGV